MPRTYATFTYDYLRALGFKFKRRKLFEDIRPIQPSTWLRQTLEIYKRQRLASGKAKAQFLIAPVLTEVAERNPGSICIFSGYNFNVDKTLGLHGFFDYVLNKNATSLLIETPFFCVTEAKNENFDLGAPPCIAGMYAARLLNRKHNKSMPAVFGASTFGHFWQFLQLEDSTVWEDQNLYDLSNLPQLLGVLQTIVDQS
jgi:hypothetical protein